jgi:hypothetical protein
VNEAFWPFVMFIRSGILSLDTHYVFIPKNRIFGADIMLLACGTTILGRCPPRWAPLKLPRPLTNVPPRPRELLCVCAVLGGFALFCSVSFVDVGRFSSILFHLFRTCSYTMGCSSWTAPAAFSLITLLKSSSTTSALRLRRRTIKLNN